MIYVYSKDRMIFCAFDCITDTGNVEALSPGAIFSAICNVILLLSDVKLANTCFHHSLLIQLIQLRLYFQKQKLTGKNFKRMAGKWWVICIVSS